MTRSASILAIFCLVQTTLAVADMNGLLYNRVFANYNGKVKPTEQTVVKFKLEVLDVGLCPKTKELNTKAWMQMMWEDSRLKWEPAHFGGIDRMQVPAKDIWVPDVTMYEEVEKTQLIMESNAVIMSSGTVIYVPPATFKTFCQPNYDNLPFGEQNCSVKVGSWTYHKGQMDLSMWDGRDNVWSFEHFQNKQGVEIIAATAEQEDKTYDCCPDELYTSFNINLRFKALEKYRHGNRYTAANIGEMTSVKDMMDI